MRAPPPSLAWVDGAWMPSTRALLRIDRWQPWGEPWAAVSLAESVPLEKGRPLHLAGHLDRLSEGCRALGWPDPDRKILARVARQLPIRNRVRRGGLRLRWWGGLDAPLFLAHAVEASAPSRGGIRLMTSAVRHYGPDSLNGRAKVAHMLPNRLARAEIEAFAEDGLRLTPDGLVAEGVWSNVFALKRGIVRTPPLGLGILEGVTRAHFIRHFRRRGLEVREEPLTRYDLWTADRVWVTSSLRGVLGVASVDGRVLGTGPVRGGAEG